MQARVDCVLINFGTQVIKKKRLVWSVLPDYLSVSYDYGYTYYKFICYLLSHIPIHLYFLNHYFYLTLLQFRNQVDTLILIVCIALKF